MITYKSIIFMVYFQSCQSLLISVSKLIGMLEKNDGGYGSLFIITNIKTKLKNKKINDILLKKFSKDTHF